jgi:hypothetical protein
MMLLILFATVVSQQNVQNQQPGNSASVSEFYKKRVKGIILNEQDDIIHGRIIAFRSKGIIFKRLKQGPFYDPKPEYIPIQRVQAFVGENGRAIWGEKPLSQRYDYLKIRNYNIKVGVNYGIGYHINSYTFSPLVADGNDYIQDLYSGSTLTAQLAYFLSPHYSVGIKYRLHRTKAELYSLASQSQLINDDITIQNYMFDVGFYQSMSRLVIFNADVALGGLFYNNDREFQGETTEISGASFSVVLSGGVDFLLTRQIAVGVELAYLFGSIKDPTVRGNSAAMEGSQRLNRFDMTAGLKFYF